MSELVEETSDGGRWQDALPEQLRDVEWIKDSKTIDDARKRLDDAKSYMGRSIKIPTDDAGEDAWNEFYGKVTAKAPGLMRSPADPDARRDVYKALGAPDSADGYEIPQVEGVDMPQEVAGLWRELAAKTSLTKDQFSTVLQALMERDKLTIEEQAAERESQSNRLRGEWGAAYESRLAEVKNALIRTGAPDWKLSALESGNMPAEDMQHYYAIAKALGSGEGSQVSTQGKSNPTGMTAGEIADRRDDIQRDLTGKTPADFPPGVYEKRFREMLRYVEMLAKAE